MSQQTTFETSRADSFRGISADKNTRRVWIQPGAFQQVAVTGTWALEENSNVPSLATDDAGTTNVFNIPLPTQFSDMIVSGSSAVDRGVQVIGLEVVYQVATSNIGAVDCTVYKQVMTSIGTPTATAITDTTTFDSGDATGLTQVLHRMKVSIAEKDRFFLDSGQVAYARLEITDGTSSDVNIIGACWHLRVVEE